MNPAMFLIRARHLLRHLDHVRYFLNRWSRMEDDDLADTAATGQAQRAGADPLRLHNHFRRGRLGRIAADEVVFHHLGLSVRGRRMPYRDRIRHSRDVASRKLQPMSDVLKPDRISTTSES